MSEDPRRLKLRPLIRGRDAQGQTIELGLIADGCAITQAGRIVDRWPSNRRGLDAAIDHFINLTGVEKRFPDRGEDGRLPGQ